jgi:alanyl-tRNA synthetase
VTETVDASSVDELKSYADRYLEKVKSGIVTVVAKDKFVIKVSKDLSSQYAATRLKDLVGSGGGRAELVNGKVNGSADEAFARLAEALS